MSVRYQNPVPQYLDSSGASLGGALLYFYENNTSTPQDTYSDTALSTPNTNPVVCDAAGRVPTIYLKNAYYTVVLKTSAGVTLWTENDVDGSILGLGATAYAADTGVADAYAIAPSPAIASYTEGQSFAFKALNANTGAATLAVNGLSTKAIQANGSALTGGEISAGSMVNVIYNGTAFQLVNNPRFGTFNSLTSTSLTTGSLIATGNITTDADSTNDIGETATRFLNVYADNLYGELQTAAQPNITSIGTLTRATVTQDLLVGAGLTDQGNGTINAENGYYLDGQRSIGAMATGLFNGQTGATISATGVSISRTAEGSYTATLSPAASNTNYKVSINGTPENFGTTKIMMTLDETHSPTTTTFKIKTREDDGGDQDVDELHVIVFP